MSEQIGINQALATMLHDHSSGGQGGQISGSAFPSVYTTSKARAFRDTSAQSIGASAWTKVQFNNESYDPGSSFTLSPDYRFTVPAGGAGYYEICAEIQVGSLGTAGVVQCAIYKGGSLYSADQVYLTVPLGQGTIKVKDILYLAAGEYVEIYVYAGNTFSIINGADKSWVDIAKVF